ncbi:hypothetical protein OF376_01720 [Ureaplasma miroungigenitalium]|uniref:Uncharacterized protein n=1 Tax=Ureaplasma miroungigenitalium TaxID=1042321 RepID=A0ABT3BML4_9BACT|nr:hypothetical protein [Ureaplasma miroungigenitalium]MCV3728483.1 hypothetical protein [Ureaplasma miroungigenitalium]
MEKSLWTKKDDKYICNNCFYQVRLSKDNYEDLMFEHEKHCSDMDDACLDINA